MFYKHVSEILERQNIPLISRKGLIEIYFDEANRKFPEHYLYMLEFVINIRKNIGDLKELIFESHNKALVDAVEPKQRTENLLNFQWKIYRSKRMDFILPDCIAITISENGSANPYMWKDLFDDCSQYAITAPLSRNCVLVGYDKFIPRFENLNAHFASCSEGFFVSPDPKHARFARHIGAWSDRIIDPFIATFIPP